LVLSRMSRLYSPWKSLSALVALLTVLCFAGSASAASYSTELTRYPYLTDVVGSSATVNWGTTRFSIAGVLKYGQAGTESCTAHTVAPTKIAMTVGTVSQFQWKAQLTGLAPDTEYCYRLYLGQQSQIDLLGTDPSPSFHSQILQGASTPYSFAVFGDWGYVDADGNNPDQANVMHQIAQSGARFALTTGDNAYTAGTQQNYGDLYQVGADTSGVFGPNFWTVAGHKIPLFPAMGNHGFSGATTALNNWPQEVAVTTSNGRAVKETHCCLNGTNSADYPSIWYAFDAGNARFYVLEAAWTSTNPGTSTQYGNDYAYHWTTDSAEYKWLQNDLATHPRALKFAFFHYPLYSDNYSENTDFFLHGQDGLEGLMNRYGVDIAFAGHAHLYQRNVTNEPFGLPNYTTGGGGAFLEPIANGSANCGQFDAYGIGWAHTGSVGSACGAAPVPTDVSQVFHFLKVGVSSNGVEVTPTDELGRTFDPLTLPVTPANADLSLTSSDSPDPAFTGETVTYTLTAQNNGPDSASGVVVTDNLPNGATYDSATPSQGSCRQIAGVVTCSLGTLASGASATIDVKVSSSTAGTLTNNASIVGDDLNDATTGNNSTSADTTVRAGADLQITKTDSADPAVIGDSLTYTLTVKDDGPLDATNVTATDNLPSGLTYQSATPSQGTCSESSGTVTCALGDLANNATATVDITVTAPNAGSVTNTASVSGDQGDGNASNNSASESTTVTGLADLSITKSGSPDPLYAGQPLTYSIAVQNDGPSDAPSATVTDNLPAGVAYQLASASQGTCSQASGTVTCDLGALANGAGATVSINVTAQAAGTITNTATVAGSGSADRNSANDSSTASTTVNPAADLSITKTDSPDPATAGQQVTYSITVRNNGPSGATGVTVTDPLPAGVSYNSATPSQGTCFQSVPGTVTCNIGGLANGATATVQIIVTATGSGAVTNTATVTRTEPDLNSANNSASATTTIAGRADLAVTNTDSPDPVILGNTLTYTLSVRNNGPSPANGVIARDMLYTANVSYQSATASQGNCSQSAGTVTCNLGTIASGSMATVTIRVNTIKQGGGVTNTATVQANETDPSTANNSATATTKINKK
jgi:uncharacterized repeat protein (TIGR01451 family)